MASWGINAVRVPLNEDCWLGINGAIVPPAVYQQSIINYVNLINQNNMWVILDLHWSGPDANEALGQEDMADKSHSLDFWSSVATVFKNNNEVIFDVYNEPHDISWSCWKNGTGCQAGYSVASMQDMINSIRSAGAANVILLAGLDYAADLSGWLSYEPGDPDNNLAASFHMYGKTPCDTQSCWNHTLAPLIAQVPVVATEFAETYDGSICSTATSDSFMQWMDGHNSGYLAWVWDTHGTNCGNLSLISNYNGTPLYPNGTDFKTHILGLTGRAHALQTDAPVKPTRENLSVSSFPILAVSSTVAPADPSPTIFCIINCPAPLITGPSLAHLPAGTPVPAVRQPHGHQNSVLTLLTAILSLFLQ
jgi:hypothetical protein